MTMNSSANAVSSRLITQAYELLESIIYTLNEDQFLELLKSKTVANDKQLVTTILTIRKKKPRARTKKPKTIA